MSTKERPTPESDAIDKATCDAMDNCKTTLQSGLLAVMSYDKALKLARSLEKQRDELRDALGAMLADLPVVECNSFHHAKKDRHTSYPCPVYKRWEEAVANARALLRNNDKKEDK
jgi:hypothetical protein